jgi:hypothetical protein
MAKAKLNDDAQVYADTLLIVYQRGFADGKKAAQRPWVGLEIEEVQDSYNADYQAQTRAVEKLLKERNT